MAKLDNKRAAIFFDRDGVLNVDRGYVYKIEDFVWINGAKEALKLSHEAGYLNIVVTNQSGIARGYYSIEDMFHLHDWMQSELSNSGGKIDGFYYCPYHDDGALPEFSCGNHIDRKPNPGMILRAAADFNIDLSKSFLIGDKQTDMLAAQRAGVEAALFDGGNLYENILSWINNQRLTN